MANVYDKETKRLLKSVNTPDYMTDRYIINPSFVPGCEPKYIIIEADDTIREMTQAEMDVVDYVAPPPELTAEELDVQIEDERKFKVCEEIGKTYDLTDELEIIREALVILLPDNESVSTWHKIVTDAKLKFPKV